MAKPKIRLKGFDGGWQLSKVHSLLEERNVQFPKSEEYPLMAFIANVGITQKGEKYDRSALIKDEVHKNYKRTEFGDFIYSSNNLESGSIGINTYGKACISPVYSIFRSRDEVEPFFIGYCFTRKDFVHKMTKWRQGVMYGQWRIHEKDFMGLSVFIPDKSEQVKLSSYFKSLDLIIQATTKKVASLKQMKSACLVSMFPQEGETIPRVRFKGFEGEWEKVTLSSIASRVTRKNSHLESTLPLTISAAEGLIEQTAFFNNIVASSNISGYYLVKRGEFAYNKSYSNGYPFGAVKRLDKFDMGVLSTLYILFSIDSTVCSDYIVHFFDTSLWHQEVAKRAAEGARNHGLLNIGADDFLDIDIMLPKSIEEQQKIASYFQSLDKQISLQEARLEKLKQIKSACLDKMFV